MDEKRYQMEKTYPRATDVTISEHYIAYATGGSVTVLDRETEEILFQVKKLSYCYSVFIEREETILIIRGTYPAYLWFYSLPDGILLKRLSIKPRRSQDCSFAVDAAGEYLLYPVIGDNLCATLLKISLSEFAVIGTVPIGTRTYVNKIWREEGIFLMTGFDRAREDEDWHTYWVAWCDGERITRKIVIDKAFIAGTDHMLYDKKRGLIYLFEGFGKYFVVDEKMRLVREGKLDFGKDEYCGGDLYLDDQNLYCPSSEAFYIYSRDTFECLFCKKRKYGFLGVKRLNDRQVLAVPFSGGSLAIDVR